MSDDPAYLRDQAARCQRLAKAMLDREGAARLVELAADYEQRARQLEISENVPVASWPGTAAAG